MGAKMIAPRIAFVSSDMWFSSLKKDPEPVTLRVTTYASLVTALRFTAPSPRLGSSAM
jgi:hypothetical protein